MNIVVYLFIIAQLVCVFGAPSASKSSNVLVIDTDHGGDESKLNSVFAAKSVDRKDDDDDDEEGMATEPVTPPSGSSEKPPSSSSEKPPSSSSEKPPSSSSEKPPSSSSEKPPSSSSEKPPSSSSEKPPSNESSGSAGAPFISLFVLIASSLLATLLSFK